MVITSPKSTEEESSDSPKFEFEFEEHSTSNTPQHQYRHNSSDKHKCDNNNIGRHSQHSSHYSLNSSQSRSSCSSDGPEHMHFDSSAITQMLLSRPVQVKRNSFDQHSHHLNDNSFAVDCLYWHNLFRAKHGSPPLTLSFSLINMAQEWANYLAHTDSFKYRNSEGVGENLMSKWTCHPEFDPPGHFTQVVWRSTEEFGIGKAHTRGGKLIVVANYRPAGNIVGQFQDNVLPRIKHQDKNDERNDRRRPTEDLYSLNEQSIHSQSLFDH